jgi:hypothetical protein
MSVASAADIHTAFTMTWNRVSLWAEYATRLYLDHFSLEGRDAV